MDASIQTVMGIRICEMLSTTIQPSGLTDDGDGYGNNQSASATQSDAFPSDGTQWNDTDGDVPSLGDNKYGSHRATISRMIPTDGRTPTKTATQTRTMRLTTTPTQWNDTDGDG